MEIEQIISYLKNSESLDNKKVINELYSFLCKDLMVSQFDSFREERTGISEVIFCQGKSLSSLDCIINELQNSPKNHLFTRMTDEQLNFFLKNPKKNFTIFPEAKCAEMINQMPEHKEGNIVLMTAGTSDLEVAREAEITLHHFGYQSRLIYDVGVSSLIRLLGNLEQINSSDVIIVFAGMEGALPTVLGSLTEIPIITVPVNIGYGAHFNGLTTLLTMLNSCSPGLMTVNIDNGFGAATAAIKILKNKYRNNDSCQKENRL